MTLIVHSLLDQCLRDNGDYDPARILEEMNRRLKSFFHRENVSVPIDDGFDAAICRIDPGENRLEFAGAGLPLYLASGKGIREIKGVRAGVGDRRTSDRDAFMNHVVDLADITEIYLATDGLTDQIGEKSRLPFGRERLKEILHGIRTLLLSGQCRALSEIWRDYVCAEEIRDDLTALGFSLSHLKKQASMRLEARETV